jgi:hypothetical protein
MFLQNQVLPRSFGNGQLPPVPSTDVSIFARSFEWIGKTVLEIRLRLAAPARIEKYICSRAKEFCLAARQYVYQNDSMYFDSMREGMSAGI